MEISINNEVISIREKIMQEKERVHEMIMKAINEGDFDHFEALYKYRDGISFVEDLIF